MATATDIDELIAANDAWDRAIRGQWDHVLEWLRDQWSVAEVEAMLRSRDFSALVTDMTRAAEAIARVVADAYAASGKIAADTVQRATGDPIYFDGNGERAVRYLRQNRLRLVREVTDAARETWTQIIQTGIQRGDNPRVMAREIRQSLGLTARQQAAVDNYRRLLRQGSTEALTRELRDRRYDRSVLRAANGGKPLTSQEIERMVGRYRQRYIDYRAEVIARTEALRAVHEGAEETYKQAIESGDIQPRDVLRTWVVAGGVNRKGKPRTRDSHRAMRGQKRPLGESFMSGYGHALRYPGDPNAPASETAQCRCVVTTRIRPQAETAPSEFKPLALVGPTMASLP